MDILKEFLISHVSNFDSVTGCSIITCPSGVVGGISIFGGAPCAYNTELLYASSLRSNIDAVFLTGGSVYGLPLTSAVQDYIKSTYGSKKVPIVPALSLFDLRVGSDVAPSYDQVMAACHKLSQDINLRGNVGAGVGATVGKVRGIRWAMKGGLGFASKVFDDGLHISALMVVNAFGDVIDGSGKVLAGARNEAGTINTQRYINEQGANYLNSRDNDPLRIGLNTTIGVVMTNALLNKAEVNKVAQMAQAGIARSINPCWTNNDGDIIVSVASGVVEADFNLVGMIAANLVSEAIVDGITSAESLEGIPSYKELFSGNG